MSTPTEGEVPAARRTAGGGDGNVFTRKLGPAPLWVWMLAGLGIALAISAVRGNKQKAAQAATTAGAAAGAAAGGSQVPPFIIQNFPGSGIPGPQGPAGQPGAPGAPGTPGAGGQGTPPPVRGGNPPASGPPDVFPAAPVFPRPVGIGVHGPSQAFEYRVKPGDTLTSIAQSHGTTAQALWQYNTTAAGGRLQSTINTLLSRGPNLLYPNELILIPQ